MDGSLTSGCAVQPIADPNNTNTARGHDAVIFRKPARRGILSTVEVGVPRF
jgi:hypothetical protein